MLTSLVPLDTFTIRLVSWRTANAPWRYQRFVFRKCPGLRTTTAIEGFARAFPALGEAFNLM
jgi:hypothetical protein